MKSFQILMLAAVFAFSNCQAQQPKTESPVEAKPTVEVVDSFTKKEVVLPAETPKTAVLEKKTTEIKPETAVPEAAPAVVSNPFEAVFAAYFGLKDALVKTDGAAASAEAAALFKAIDKVETAKLRADWPLPIGASTRT